MKKGFLGIIFAMLMFSCSGLAKEETLVGKSYVLHVEKVQQGDAVIPEEGIIAICPPNEEQQKAIDKAENKLEKTEASKKIKKRRERGVISLSFNEEDFYGSGGVNRYFGKYEAKKGKIKFDYFASTRMMGPAPMMEKEQNYFKTLAEVVEYEIKEDGLVLTTADGTELKYDQVENKEENKEENKDKK